MKRFNISYCEHDTSLQKQDIKNPNIRHFNGKIEIFPWKAIYDEREDKFFKSIVIFVFSWDKLTDDIHQISEKVTLSFYKNLNEEPIIDGTSDISIFTDNLLSGMIIIYPLRKLMECPRYVRLNIDDNQPTNLLFIERQTPKKISDVPNSEPTLIVCAAMITNNMSVSPTRLAEYLEYNRLIGVSKVFMPYFDPNIYQDINLGAAIYSVEDHFERIGFLEKIKVARYIHIKKSTFRSVRLVNSHVISYCMIKNALQFDHVIIQDFDEIIGFDHNKYKSLADVLKSTKSWTKIYQFHDSRHCFLPRLLQKRTRIELLSASNYKSALCIQKGS